MMKPAPVAHSLLALAAILPLSGCISFSPKPPHRLMVLTPANPLQAGPPRTAGDAQAVAVAPIAAIPSLATPRIMVADGSAGIAYIAKDRWAAPPNVLFRALLAETITARTGRIVPDARLIAVTPDTRLSGQLSAFGLDAPGQAAVVTFDASITRAGRDQVEYRRFTTRVPTASHEGEAVAAAINQAANTVAADVADWIGTR
jgi:cholesterol transport system auxiliary component